MSYFLAALLKAGGEGLQTYGAALKEAKMDELAALEEAKKNGRSGSSRGSSKGSSKAEDGIVLPDGMFFGYRDKISEEDMEIWDEVMDEYELEGEARARFLDKVSRIRERSPTGKGSAPLSPVVAREMLRDGRLGLSGDRVRGTGEVAYDGNILFKGDNSVIRSSNEGPEVATTTSALGAPVVPQGPTEAPSTTPGGMFLGFGPAPSAAPAAPSTVAPAAPRGVGMPAPAVTGAAATQTPTQKMRYDPELKRFVKAN